MMLMNTVRKNLAMFAHLILASFYTETAALFVGEAFYTGTAALFLGEVGSLSRATNSSV